MFQKMKALVLTADPNTLICHRGELIKTFAAKGWKVVAAAAGESERAAVFMASVGGEYRALPLARSSLNPAKDIAFAAAVEKLIRRERPDTIFAYTIKSVIYGCLMGALCRVPRRFALIPGLGYAFTPDGTWKQRLVGFASATLYRLALRFAHHVFLQNHDDEALLRERGILPEDVPSTVTLGSGVHLGEFAMRAPRPPMNGTLRCVLVTRLLESKGVRIYAEAAKILRAENRAWEFQLVGPGDPSPDGINQAEACAWTAKKILNYRGSLTDVRPPLADADVFVLPTYYREGVPRSALEALAAGRPIITTDAVGARETVELTAEGKAQRERGEPVMQGTNGFLIRPRDAAALAEALRRCAALDADAFAALSRRAREIAEERFDVRRVNTAILAAMNSSGQRESIAAAATAPTLS